MTHFFTGLMACRTGLAASALVLAALAVCGGGDDSIAVTIAPVVTPPMITLPTCTAAVAADAPLRDISAVQGTGDISPLVSQSLTVRGGGG